MLLDDLLAGLPETIRKPQRFGGKGLLFCRKGTRRPKKGFGEPYFTLASLLL
jgi:hypothetical protein